MTRKSWSDFMAKASQPALFAPPSQPKRKRRGAFRPPEPYETDIQKVILEALKLHPLVRDIERINVIAGRLLGKGGKVSRFVRSSKPGRCDLEGMATDGKLICIEVKRPSNRSNTSKEQRERIDMVKAAGGYAGVATCVEEAFAIIEGRSS